MLETFLQATEVTLIFIFIGVYNEKVKKKNKNKKS